ncbi:MAG: hypothetical protein GY853_13135 [PVC group bacterium]|nr:hypothetical protein [PVC group bacterium]
MVPRFYGLPKIHKTGRLRIRPIIANSGLYSDSTMLHMKDIINLLPTNTTSIKHSYELTEILDGFEFTDSSMLVSLDVQSLFTRVPVKETLQIVEAHLTQLNLENPDRLRATTTLT